LNEKVLLKCQLNSDAALGITEKLMSPLKGPWLITKIIPSSNKKISKKEEKNKETFNIKKKKKKI
jgi:hypothetical protein